MGDRNQRLGELLGWTYQRDGMGFFVCTPPPNYPNNSRDGRVLAYLGIDGTLPDFLHDANALRWAWGQVLFMEWWQGHPSMGSYYSPSEEEYFAYCEGCNHEDWDKSVDVTLAGVTECEARVNCLIAALDIIKETQQP